MTKNFQIPPNPILVQEAENAILLAEKSSLDQYIYIQRQLNEILNKIFAFRDQTFKQAESFLYSSPIGDKATVTLDVDLENAIVKIFDCQQNLFKKHRTAMCINIHRQ